MNVHPRRAPSRFDSSPAGTRCLVFQTDHPLLVRDALEKLRDPSLYPACRLALVHRQEDLESFEDLRDVELLPFPRRGEFRIRDFLRQVTEFRPDLICGVFNRRPVFRKQKLLFFLLPVRRRLILDGRMNPYHLRLGNLPAILRRSRYEGKLPGEENVLREKSTILYLPTEEDSIALEVLSRLQDRKIVGPGRILVFCSDLKKTLYASRPEVCEVVAYGRGQRLRNLRTVVRLAMMKIDVVVAILSGRPIFRAHKRLFFLLPARSRLVFNEHGDCHYVKRTLRDLVGLWRTPSLPKIKPYQRVSRREFRFNALILVKAILFFPRYVYLILWLLLGCLKKGGSKRLVVFRKGAFGKRDYGEYD